MPKRKKASDVYFVDEILDERIHDVYLHSIKDTTDISRILIQFYWIWLRWLLYNKLVYGKLIIFFIH